jgi:hypothetical protein
MTMIRKLRSNVLLCMGLVMGLSIGGAMTLGVLVGKRTTTSAYLPALEELRLRASASHGADNFAIATGQVDEEIEGLFTLDFVTGDLQCFVINSRTGGMAGRFATNVNDAKVFGAKRGKKPNFLMTTGSFAAGATSGGARPAACLCYVVDANTGDVAAFGFPWNRAVTTSGGVQSTAMVMMGRWQARAGEAVRQ